MCGFLSLHIVDEFSEPINRQLVGYSGHNPSIVLDLLIEFLALVTHSGSASEWSSLTTASQ
jgi:hypothetical protein